MPSPLQGDCQLKHRVRTYLALLLCAALLTPALPAHAAPTAASKQAEAAAIKQQVDALDNKSQAADENYVVAADKHAKLVGQQRVAAAKLAKAQKRLNSLEAHLDTRANDMYREGAVGVLDVLFGAKTFEQFAATWDILKQLNTQDAADVAQVKVVRAETAAANKELIAKSQAAARQQAIMKSNRDAAFSELSQRKALLRGVEAQVAALEAQEEAERAAQASSWVSSGSRNWPHPTIPAHGDVVAYARSRIGCPYRWAASGPDSFDCSGLTMWCYAHVGISLPHSSAEQYSSGQHVSRSDLEPGDLVFFGSPIHHVGLYIGGGMMIEAPYTGARVREAAIDRSDYAGACRP